MRTQETETSRTAGSGGLKPLNEPRVVIVEATRNGIPRTVSSQGVLQPVRAIHESWRIDDEWWRKPISRRYFRVELRNGRRLTIYRDLVDGAWYAQNYTPPQASIIDRWAS